MRQRLAQVIDQQLVPITTDGGSLPPIPVGSPSWYAWLADEQNGSFSLHTRAGSVTVRRERKRNSWYWYAYQRRGGKLHKAYIGRASELTPDRLNSVAAMLTSNEAPRSAATQLFLLGPPRLLQNGRPVTLTSVKALALLAYLAIQRTPQRREHILALLWPESSDEAARKNLRNTLWLIRTTVGHDIIIANHRLSLNDSVWVDAHELETFTHLDDTRLAPLQEQYSGIFLDGVAIDDSAEFEIWLTAERERLEQLYLRAVQTQIDNYRVAGDWRAIIPVAQEALSHDPLQEALHRVLMEAYARLGRRSEALRQYDTLRSTLERELHIAPLLASEALRAAILNGDLQPILQTAEACDTPRPRSAAPQTPFVGRHSELKALSNDLQQAQRGQARVVVLTGELGIGKTRLWQEWIAQRTTEQRVLETRCLSATQMIPFAPLLNLFLSPVCAQVALSDTEGAAPSWIAEIVSLTSHLRSNATFVPAATAPQQIDERYRIFEAFLNALRALSNRPLALFIDDIQWADQSTLEWLAYLVQQLYNRPLLIIAAYRQEEAGAPLVRLMAEWSRSQVLRRLPLARLTLAEARELIAALDGDLARADELYTQSAGNPYYLTELVRAAPGDVPPALTDIVRARIDALPENARRLLQVAVILDPEIDFPTLQRTSGRDEDQTLDALDALLDAGILSEQHNHYTFNKPLVATVARESISAARRAALHRRAAEAIEALHPDQLSHFAGQLATHYAAAGDIRRGAAYADMAAEQALLLAAPAEAANFYRRALELAPTSARYTNLGQALVRQSDIAGARSTFETALRFAEHEQSPFNAASACLGLAGTYLMDGAGEQVIFWARRGLTRLVDEQRPDLCARAYFLLGAGLSQLEQAFEEAESYLTQAAYLADEHHIIEMIGASRFELGNLLARRGDLSAAIAAFQHAANLSRQLDHTWPEILAHNNIAYHSMLAGDLAAAHQHIESGLRLAEEHSLEIPKQWLYSTSGEIALAERRWDDAERWFTDGFAITRQYGNKPQMATYQANLALTARGRGDLDSAVLQLEQAREQAALLATPHLQIQIDLWLAELYIERGESTAGAAALDRAEQQLNGSNYQRLREWADRVGRELRTEN
jgi:DNA-binding SARP family transcriptional activator